MYCLLMVLRQYLTKCPKLLFPHLTKLVRISEATWAHLALLETGSNHIGNIALRLCMSVLQKQLKQLKSAVLDDI